MVKKDNPKTHARSAMLMTAIMVLASWAGWQVLVLSGCFYKIDNLDEAEYFLAIGVALLLYSLYVKLRLRRLEISPWRESARMFYLAAIVALPFLTYAYFHDVLRRWLVSDNVLATFEYSTFVISTLYMIMFGIWVNSEVPHYPVAPHYVWWRRIQRWFVVKR